jgi:TolB-like protein/Flp pilus assembly protein TadD
MANEMGNLRDHSAIPSSEDRLNSWKEIAAYLKYSERTVRRWEEEGLPVHRHPHKTKAAIYAYKPEIEAWWRDGHERLKQIEELQEERRPNAVVRWHSWTWLATGIVLAAAFVTVLWLDVGGLRERIAGRAVGVRIESLAVLPLENLSHDLDQEYLSDGMTDALITDLAQIGSLKVISRTSSMQYKQTKKSLPEIARELNVDGIVEGTVQRSGDRVRITAQLIEAASDRHVWAKTYEGDLGDILAVESDVARTIVNEIKIQLTPEQRARLASAAPVNHEAYELYLKGRYFWSKRDPDGLKKALDYFQRAAEREPEYAPAQAGIADAYSLLAAAGYDVLPRAEAMEKARDAANKALRIDGTLAEAHASLGYVIYSYDWNWAGAEKEFKRAIALNPNYSTAHQWYSEYLNDLQRNEEALAEAQAALTLDPISVVANHCLARAHYFARRMDQAIETSKKILEMDPNFAAAHLRLGRAYAAKGMYPEAIKQFREFASLSGDIPLATASIGNALARSGDRSGAIHTLNELAVLSRRRRVPAICFALVHVGLGDKDPAIAQLEAAYNERSDFLLVLKADPLFDPLRSDLRFQDLLRRMNLPIDSTNGGISRN